MFVGSTEHAEVVFLVMFFLFGDEFSVGAEDLGEVGFLVLGGGGGRCGVSG